MLCTLQDGWTTRSTTSAPLAALDDLSLLEAGEAARGEDARRHDVPRPLGWTTWRRGPNMMTRNSYALNMGLRCSRRP